MSQLSGLERWWLGALPYRVQIKRFVPKFLRASPDPFRGEVLEIGSGAGWTSRCILETFPQVELTASDVDDRAKRKFKQLRTIYGQRLRFKQADLLSLPFDRSSFDIVIVINVFQHVDDLQEATRQLLRVLRPGGLIGVGHTSKTSGVNIWSRLFSSSSLSKQTIKIILQDEGCEVVCSKGGAQYYVWARKPYPLEVPED
jgi:ubiquinone/menaquinone biosynthesis C-methylase UbiE